MKAPVSALDCDSRGVPCASRPCSAGGRAKLPSCEARRARPLARKGALLGRLAGPRSTNGQSSMHAPQHKIQGLEAVLLCCKGIMKCGNRRYVKRNPVAIRQVGFLVAEKELPTYSHRFAPHRYRLAQLCACCPLRVLLRQDLRGIEALLAVSPELRRALGLSRVPDHSTLCRFQSRGLTPERLDRTLGRVCEKAGVKQGAVAADSTGLEASRATAYFEMRRGGRRKACRKSMAGGGEQRPSSPASNARWEACCKLARLLVSAANPSSAPWSTACAARRGCPKLLVARRLSIRSQQRNTAS